LLLKRRKLSGARIKALLKSWLKCKRLILISLRILAIKIRCISGILDGIKLIGGRYLRMKSLLIKELLMSEIFILVKIDYNS
jgi:hypothetical protein